MRKFTFTLLWLLTFTVPWEEMIAIPGLGTIARTLGYSLVFFGLLAVFSQGRFKKLDGAHFVMAGYLLWCGATVTWSLDQDMSMARLFTYVRVVGLGWLTWEFAQTKAEQFKLMKAYVLGCSVPIVGTFWAAWGGQNVLAGGAQSRYAGAGMNENDQAALLAISILFALHLAEVLTFKWKYGRWMYWLYCAAAFLAILLTGSRTGILALVTGGILYSIHLAGFMRARPKTAVVLFAVVISSLLLAPRLVPASTLKRVQMTGHEIQYGSWSDRRTISQIGWNAFLDHPVAGYGVGTFYLAMWEKSGWMKDAHSTYLNILVGTGIIGAFLFFIVFLRVLDRVRRLPSLQRILWLSVIAMWVVTGISTSWDYRKVTWLIFGLALAQGASYLQPARKAGATPLRPVPSALKTSRGLA